MLEIRKDKRTEEQGNLYLKKIQPKIGHIKKKNGNSYEIIMEILFLISILILTTTTDIYLKYKSHNSTDIISSFDFYNRVKESIKQDLNLKEIILELIDTNIQILL